MPLRHQTARQIALGFLIVQDLVVVLAIVLEPFQDAADRAVDILCGGKQEERRDFPSIETEEKQPA